MREETREEEQRTAPVVAREYAGRTGKSGNSQLTRAFQLSGSRAEEEAEFLRVFGHGRDGPFPQHQRPLSAVLRAAH